MKQKRTIRNQSRTINLMINPNDIYHSCLIQIAADSTPWRNERGAPIIFSEGNQ